MKRNVVGLALALIVSSCGGGGSDNDDIGSIDSTLSDDAPSELIGGIDGICGSDTFFPEGDILRLVDRDEDAWHLFEVDLEQEFEFASYDQLISARALLDSEVKLLVPLVIDQMAANAAFIAGGGQTGDADLDETLQIFAADFNEAIPIVDQVGEIVGLEGGSNVFYQVPGECGGEILVRINGQMPGSPEIVMTVGQQFDSLGFPLGYNIEYQYFRGVDDEGIEFSSTLYTKLGRNRTIVNHQSVREGGLAAGDTRSFNEDFAVTNGMIESVRQLRTGIVEN